MPTITPLDFEKEIREFRGQQQALKLPPINQSNGFENFFKREDKLHKNLKLLDITTTSKRRKLSRQKIKKKAKNVKEEFSSKVKKVKNSAKHRQRKEFQVKLQSHSPLFQVPVVQGTLLFKDNNQQGVLGAIMGKKHT